MTRSGPTGTDVAKQALVEGKHAAHDQLVYSIDQHWLNVLEDTRTGLRAQDLMEAPVKEQRDQPLSLQ